MEHINNVLSRVISKIEKGDDMGRHKGRAQTPKEDVRLIRSCIEYKLQKQALILEHVAIIQQLREDIDKFTTELIAEKMEVTKGAVDRIQAIMEYSHLSKMVV